MENITTEEIEKIRKNPDNQNWETISRYQKLSEDFIKEFQDKVDWVYIPYKQKLSEEFIGEFYQKINFKKLLNNKDISNEVKEFCRMFL